MPLFLEDGNHKKLKPMPQEGEPAIFKRRKPEESQITLEMDLEKFMTILECWMQRAIQGRL